MNLNFKYFAMVTVILVTQAATAARQEVTVEYKEIQTRLTLKPGKTFLTFMKEEVKPGLDSYQDTITHDSAYEANRWSELQKNLLEQGAGVAIRIDRNNYFFNIGYLNGSDPQNDVKSGRSYGVGPTHAQSDPSDIAYLKELQSYLQNEPQAAGTFVSTLMKVITNCDASGWKDLSEDGQIVATDFLAIYTAELDRHLMVDLNPNRHPWEIDLAAATFVSIYSAKTGFIMQDGELVEGGLDQWWAKGNQGSGIGNTRRDRKALQGLIAKSMKHHSEHKSLQQYAGEGEDVIQSLLEFLNSEEAPAKYDRTESDSLSELMGAYLSKVQEHAEEFN